MLSKGGMSLISSSPRTKASGFSWRLLFLFLLGLGFSVFLFSAGPEGREEASDLSGAAGAEEESIWDGSASVSLGIISDGVGS